MTETYYEIDRDTYETLKNDDLLLKSFGKTVARNSFFKPSDYNYYGCWLYKSDSEYKKYYLVWKHNKEKHV